MEINFLSQICISPVRKDAHFNLLCDGIEIFFQSVVI